MEGGAATGWARADGLVWGSYLHGLFDADGFRRQFVDQLRARKGLAPLGRVVAAYDIELALDRLADALRASLDWRALYKRMAIA